MTRLDALGAIYPRLHDTIVVTIMGAVAAELQSIGHRPNFFYLQHAMGLASSMGLGLALCGNFLASSSFSNNSSPTANDLLYSEAAI